MESPLFLLSCDYAIFNNMASRETRPSVEAAVGKRMDRNSWEGFDGLDLDVVTLLLSGVGLQPPGYGMGNET